MRMYLDVRESCTRGTKPGHVGDVKCHAVVGLHVWACVCCGVCCWLPFSACMGRRACACALCVVRVRRCSLFLRFGTSLFCKYSHAVVQTTLLMCVCMCMLVYVCLCLCHVMCQCYVCKVCTYCYLKVCSYVHVRLSARFVTVVLFRLCCTSGV